MPSTGAIKAGRAFVELFADDSKLRRSLAAAQARIRGWAKRVQSIARVSIDIDRGGQVLTNAGFALGASAGAGLAAFARHASDAEEAINRFNQVFGPQAQEAGRFADQLAERVGRSGGELRDAMATFQGFGVGLGFEPTEARAISETLTRLGLDLASFNNLSDAEAFDRLLSAMSGSSEVLDKFGINIKEAALQQEALRRGWDPRDLSESQKVMARLAITARSLTDQGAVGDAERTAGSYANTMKRLRAGLKQLAVVIGTAILPMLTRFASRGSSVVKAVTGWARANQPLLAQIGTLAAGVVVAGAALLGLGIGLRLVAAGLLSVSILLSPVQLGLKLVAGAIGLVIKSLAAAPALLGALLSPAALAVAGLAALAGVAVYLTGALGPLMQGWADLGRVVTDTLDGIRERLAAGDLAGAAKVAWAGLQAVWQVGIARLLEAWNTFRYNFARAAVEVFYGAASIAVDAVAQIRNAWADLKGWFATFWADTSNAATETWNLIALKAKQAGNAIRGALDESFDSDAANRAAEEGFVADQQAAQRKQRSAVDDARKANAASRDTVERERRAAQASIATQLDGMTQALARLVSDAQAQGDQAVAEALNELHEQVQRIQQTSTPGAASAPTADPEASEIPGLNIDELLDRIKTGGDAAQQTSGASAQGSFDARALGFLGGPNRDLVETARNTRETARHAKRIAEARGLVFG